MFFEENLNDTVEDDGGLEDNDTSLLPLSQTSDGETTASLRSTQTAREGGVLGGVFGASTATAISTTHGNAPSAAVIQLLMEATANERFSPEVLPYPAAVVKAVTQLLQRSQQRVKSMIESEKQSQTRSFLPFRPSDILQLELQRIQFFLCELLRCRLRKIDQLCLSIWYEAQVEEQQQRRSSASVDATEEEEDTARGMSTDSGDRALSSSPSRSLLEVRVPQRRNLSPQELVVADRLAMSVQRAVIEGGLQGAPPALQFVTPHPPAAEGLEILPEPDLGTYVFGVALDDLGVVSLGEGMQEASRAIGAGEVFLTPYRNFRPFVMSGQVRLV